MEVYPLPSEAVPVAIRLADATATISLPIQPYPTKASVSHLRVGQQVVTGIYRVWPEGASGPRGTCRLCPSCTADADRSCHHLVRRYIAPQDAPLFALVDLPNPVRQHV